MKDSQQLFAALRRQLAKFQQSRKEDGLAEFVKNIEDIIGVYDTHVERLKTVMEDTLERFRGALDPRSPELRLARAFEQIRSDCDD